MKLILLAATALLATPALAQTSGSTGTSSPTSNGGQGTAATSAVPNNTQGSMSGDMSSMPAQSSMPSSSMSTGGSMATSGGDPVGGYQPAGSPMSGPMQPGATVVFQPAQSPDQAYPAPAPMAHYPMCKKGQFDNCMQGPGSTHSREVRGRR